MKVKQVLGATVVRFSATEVAAAGGPPIGATITYRNGRLDDLSSWLFKQCGLSPVIDKLQSIADREVYSCQ